MELRPPLHLGVVALEKRTFRWPSANVANFTYFDFTLGRSGPGRNDNEWVLYIPQISKAGASPSDGLMLYLG